MEREGCPGVRRTMQDIEGETHFVMIVIIEIKS
jgi:hypothetical protein